MLFRSQQLIEYFNKIDNPTIIAYNVNYRMLSIEALDLFIEAKVPLSCWTVDNQDAIQSLINKNIEFITTNNILYAMKIRNQSCKKI